MIKVKLSESKWWEIFNNSHPYRYRSVNGDVPNPLWIDHLKSYGIHDDPSDFDGVFVESEGALSALILEFSP